MMKKVVSLFLVCLLMAAVVGCNQVNDEDIVPNGPDQAQGENQNGNINPDADQNGDLGENQNGSLGEDLEKQDNEITEQLEAEPRVMGARVNKTNDIISAAITMEEGVAEADGKALADKYLGILQEKYPGQRINIQVVSGGKALTQIDTRDQD